MKSAEFVTVLRAMEAVFTHVSPKHNEELRQLKRTLFRPYFGIEMGFCLVLFFALLWVFGANLYRRLSAK